MNATGSQLDLVKKVELVLEKKGFAKNIVAKVAIVLDESGSVAGMFQDGTISRQVDRALAVGYSFDDDGEIDVWSFAGPGRFVQREPATQDQYGSYLKHSMLSGSTCYHEVLNAVAKDYYAPSFKDVVTEKASVLGKLFGMKDKTKVEVTPAENVPSFVVFITDGMPDNEEQALREVRKVLEAHPKMFVQFIGIGFSKFRTLERLAEENENAAFATIDPNDSDDVVLDKFLNEKARKVLEA